MLLKARPFTATIREKGEVTKVKTFQIAVGNGRHYGGGNVIEASAEIDDGHLDLYSLELSTVWKLAGMLRSFRAGTHGAWNEVRTARCVEFDIETTQADAGQHRRRDRDLDAGKVPGPSGRDHRACAATRSPSMLPNRPRWRPDLSTVRRAVSFAAALL